MMIPPFLNTGDTVKILSTARKISLEEIRYAKQILETWGLKVLFGKTIGAEYNQFAGNDKLRSEDFQNAIDDPSIRAIFCARGGYGTARILPLIDFTNYKNNLKWIIGYSDVTAIHNTLNKNGIASIHATMPINFQTTSKESINYLREILFGKKTSYTLTRTVSSFQRIKAPIVGGNLSIIYSLIGTPYDINTNDKILFIEDLDEYLYHVDRMILALKLSGKLSHLKALIVGGMTKMNDNSIPFGKTPIEIIKEHTNIYKYPVITGFPSGHINKNYPIILGENLEIKCQNDMIKFLTS